MNANERLLITPIKDADSRVKARDWERVLDELDAQGCAVIEGLLGPAECDALAGLYTVDGLLRSRVVMDHHGFSRGEYQLSVIRPCFQVAESNLSAPGADREPLKCVDEH